jgi:hypothetical protein
LGLDPHIKYRAHFLLSLHPNYTKETNMDPNVALSKLRAALSDDPANLGTNGITARMSDAAESFDALDTWLKAGGFLPVEWHGPLR